ncbi:MAG: hypothetical protein ACT4PI_17040 [Actinomycetota bacterium]
MTSSTRRGYDQWRRALDVAVDCPDPTRANLLITQGHYELSLALRDVLGLDAGANFHTWAVWGSREAGTTISQRDVPGLRVAGAVVAGGAALALMPLVDLPVAGALASATLAYGIAARELREATERISAGNRLVLDEIGGETARFVATFSDDIASEPTRIADFCAGLRPGPTHRGGQQLLRRAFTNYHAAARTPDVAMKHELTFLANCQAVWHEHIRLQSYIAGAMPRPFRRRITRRLLDFRVGPEPLHVGRDLDVVAGRSYPSTLDTLVGLETVGVVEQLRRPARPPTSLVDSGARNWADLADRMNYIVDLFRSRHLEPSVFEPPYPSDETEDLRAELGFTAPLFSS